MRTLRFVLAANVLLTFLTLSSACLSTCRFKLCRPGSVSLHRKSDVPLTPAICLNSRRVGVVNTGEARVESFSGKFRLISRLTPRGLKQKYTPHFFKAYALKPRKRNRGSGIGHEVPQQNQKDFLDGRCVALPINEYQKLSRGTVVENIQLRGRPLIDCVSFMVDMKDTNTPRPSRSPTVEDPTPTPEVVAPTPDEVISTPDEVTSTPGEVTSTPDEVTSTDTPTPSDVDPIPEFVDPGDTIEFPPTTELNEKTSFKFNITVSAESGSTKEDFYLLSDATGSMGTAILDAKERFMEVVQARQAASTDVAFGVGFYRDESEDPNFSNVQAITKDIPAVNAAIDSLVAQGGRDTPEANLLALNEIATSDDIGWREGSRRILVYFGDAVGHEPSCVGDLVLRRDNVVEALNEKKITVVATSFDGDGLNSLPSDFNCPASEEGAGVGQATFITEGTGGQLVDAEEQTELIESILSSVSGLAQSLEADTSDCDAAGVEISFAPVLPLEIDAGDTVTVQETVKVSACGTEGGSFECMVKFTLGGADLGTQTLKSSALTGC